MITISRATIQDTKAIMCFMNNVWKEGHILSKHKELFLHEFQDGENLNFIVAKDHEKNIIGIFGFIKYNYTENPDMAGSLWKVDPKVKEPLLGLKLREYFKKNIKHRFFAAPGAGLQTKPIYKIIKVNWAKMEQFYIANPTIKNFKIAKNPLLKKITTFSKKTVSILKVEDVTKLKSFVFDNKESVPYKDFTYFIKRFVSYPIYKYDIFTVMQNDTIKNIFVCRSVSANGAKVYRIVDFYGQLDYIKEIAYFFYNYIIEHNFEYVDFIAYGFDKKLLEDAGFSPLDFNNDSVVIPNFFEPFMQKNTPVYCVWDKTHLTFRQCKADGDQDRPNELKYEKL